MPVLGPAGPGEDQARLDLKYLICEYPEMEYPLVSGLCFKMFQKKTVLNGLCSMVDIWWFLWLVMIHSAYKLTMKKLVFLCEPSHKPTLPFTNHDLGSF